MPELLETIDDADNTLDDTPGTIANKLPFEAQVLHRLTKIEGRLGAIESIVEGRTKIVLKIIELFHTCLKGVGSGISMGFDRFTNPSRGFILLWVLTLVSIGGLTVADVFDFASLSRQFFADDVPGDETPARDEPRP